MYCRWSSSYQEGRVGVPLTGLTPPQFCACPKPGHGFSTSYGAVLFMFSEFRWEVVVRFAYIGRINRLYRMYRNWREKNLKSRSTFVHVHICNFGFIGQVVNIFNKYICTQVKGVITTLILKNMPDTPTKQISYRTI